MEKSDTETSKKSAEIRHLAPKPVSVAEAKIRDMELAIAGHFREQNVMLSDLNRSLSEKLQRLTNGVEALVAEMHGVRTGKKEEAFARVCGVGASPDLPTIGAEAALIYIYTAKQIGAELGIHASQVGLLLSDKGLRWAGNGDYQEMGRSVSKSQSKFWHREVPERLRKILDESQPEKYGIKLKGILTIFSKWKLRSKQNEMLRQFEASAQAH